VAGDGDGGKDTGTHVDPETVKNVEALVEHLNASWATATPTRHSSGVNVTPIFKGGNPRLPSNYRTVGVGDYMTKVLLTALERRGAASPGTWWTRAPFTPFRVVSKLAGTLRSKSCSHSC
jgi:hypothetical protein